MKTSRDICHMRVRSPVTTVTASLFPKHSVIAVQNCQLLYDSIVIDYFRYLIYSLFIFIIILSELDHAIEALLFRPSFTLQVVDKPCEVREPLSSTLGCMSLVYGLLLPLVVGEC